MISRRLALSLLGLSCLAAMPALAAPQDGLARLREALDQVPALLLDSPAPVQGAFVQLSALSLVAGAPGPWDPATLRRAVVGGEITPLATLGQVGVERWTAPAGVAPQQVEAMFGLGRGLALWRLADEAAAGAVMAHLRGRGFRAEGEALVDPGPVPLMDRMSDPWRSLPGPSAVLQQGASLLQLQDAAAAAQLRDQPAATSRPALEVALQGIAARGGAGGLVQAVLLSPVLANPPADPAVLLQGGMEAARKALAEPPAAFPTWQAGLMADLAGPGRAGLVVALGYADCDKAKRAAAEMGERWRRLAGPGGAAAQTALLAGEGVAKGACAALLQVEGAPDGPRNPFFETVWNALMRRQPTPFGG
ncbi:hypothetical protein [Roseomonas sp. USHLN139]|uniref:hypothetical protein n=1 Tax=Roseomonas sp. USHLN139 TaxID=3081298 RepID=UPI003B024C37